MREHGLRATILSVVRGTGPALIALVVVCVAACDRAERHGGAHGGGAGLVVVRHGIAAFRGSELVTCAEATIAHPPTRQPSGLSAEEVALLLADDGVVAGHGGRSLLSGTPDPARLTAQLREMMFAVPADRQRVLAQTQAAIRERLDPVSLKARDAVRVDRCTLNDRTSLATCQVEERASQLQWSVVIHHFDPAVTHASDTAMKRCLAVKGAWNRSTGHSL